MRLAQYALLERELYLDRVPDLMLSEWQWREMPWKWKEQARTEY